MTHPDKKIMHAASEAKHKKAHESSYSMQNLHGKTHAISSEVAKNLKTAAGNFSSTAKKCGAAYKENMSALLKSGTVGSKAFKNIKSEIANTHKRMLSDFMELSQEATACRSFDSAIKLQNKAIQQLSDNYFETSSKLRNMLFDSCAKAWTPISERSTIVSEQLKQKLAA